MTKILIKGEKDDLQTITEREKLDQILEKLYNDLQAPYNHKRKLFNDINAMFIAKIYDEQSTLTGQPYQFQVFPEEENDPQPIMLAKRIKNLYNNEHGNCAFKKVLGFNNSKIDPKLEIKLRPCEIKYIVKTLQYISFLKNNFAVFITFLRGLAYLELKQKLHSKTEHKLLNQLYLTCLKAEYYCLHYQLLKYNNNKEN